MSMLKNPKVVAIVATALCVASVIWLLNTKQVNSSLEAGLRSGKLQSEALLSEKLLLEKDIRKMKDQLAGFNSRNIELNGSLKNVTAELASREAEYNRLKRENVSLAQVRKQRQELRRLHADLEKQFSDLQLAYNDLQHENQDLNQTLLSLEDRNRLLFEDLERAMYANVDHTRVLAVKKKDDRLTVKARKTRKLIATFEVPGHLKNLSFRLIDANGKTLTSEDGMIASVATPSQETITASSETQTVATRPQQVQMTYIPKSKLKRGVYTVEILNENLYVGSLQVKLQ